MQWTEPWNRIAISSYNPLEIVSYSCLPFVFKVKALVWTGKGHLWSFLHNVMMWTCMNFIVVFFLLFHFEEVRKLPILLLSGGKILFIFFPPGGRLPFFFFLNKQRQTLIISEMKQSKHSFSFPLWSHCVWFIPWRFWPWSLTSETT